MPSFTVLFLTLGIIVGALVRSCKQVQHNGHGALVIAALLAGVSSLFIFQATNAGFEAFTAALLWVVGYTFGLLACTGFCSSGHKTP